MLRISILIGLWLWCLTVPSTSLGQDGTSNQNGFQDSVYLIQFVALKDCARSFDEFNYLGEVIKEYFPSRDICRYSLGYFGNIFVAETALSRIRDEGFGDAFIRKTVPDILSPLEVIGAQPPLTRKEEIVSPEDLVSTTERNKKDTGVSEKQIPEDSQLSSPDEEILPAEKEVKEKKITLLYTGKSLGVLGNTRSQKEHELVTEYAIENDVKFKLVSHACWRTKGLTIFLPSDEPEGDEFQEIINSRQSWEVLESYPALRTNNVLMFRDPDRTDFDMLSVVLKNEHTYRAFPEIEKVYVRIYRTVIDEDKECLIIEEEGAKWPTKEEHWSIGEINRVDFGKTGRLFELPINQGNFSSRVTVIGQLLGDSDTTTSHLIVDLGHRNGDFDVPSGDRALADFEGLDILGYRYVVPFEFELSLGIDTLLALNQKHKNITWLASNVSSPGKPLFKPFDILTIDGVKIGLIGLVEPKFETNLPGKILKGYRFKNIIDAAQIAVEKLLMEEVDVIVALSNMSSDQNAIVAERVYGIDVIAADFSGNGTPFNYTKEVRIPHKQKRGYGRPYHVANSYDYGIAVGKLDFYFTKGEDEHENDLITIVEQNYPVNDRVQSDTVLVNQITSKLDFRKREKGDLLFPAFIDLIDQNSKLEDFDEVTKHGRMSKALWEKFLANLLRASAPAEVAMIREVPSFLPLIGKLHEREIRSWLWMEDDVVLMDMKGRDIRRLMEADHENQLVTSGISSFNTPNRRFWFVMGRFLQEDVYYRVATTNVITNGALKEHFAWAFRVKDKFEVREDGQLKGAKEGRNMPLREFAVHELKRIRSLGKGKSHHRRIASILDPPTPYEKLFTFSFDNPRVWSSFNGSYKGDGYESIPESRIISTNTFVIGLDGGVILTLDKEKSAFDLGIHMSFAQQSANQGGDIYQTTETMDDLNFNLTYRYKGKNSKAFHPFARLLYDSEFTSTFNSSTGLDNPKQSTLRNIIGLNRESSMKWPILEIGLTVENDFALDHYQYGIQGRSVGRFPLRKDWQVMYRLTNNFNYFFPTPNDTNRELAYKYNMIHELLVPLLGNVSLSVGADFFFFQGKTEINNDPGMNMLMRVGVTYNRRWKPRFQPLF